MVWFGDAFLALLGLTALAMAIHLLRDHSVGKLSKSEFLQLHYGSSVIYFSLALFTLLLTGGGLFIVGYWMGNDPQEIITARGIPVHGIVCGAGLWSVGLLCVVIAYRALRVYRSLPV